MDYLIGVALALGVSVFAALAGFDRDRAFYPTLLMVWLFRHRLPPTKEPWQTRT